MIKQSPNLQKQKANPIVLLATIVFFLLFTVSHFTPIFYPAYAKAASGTDELTQAREAFDQAKANEKAAKEKFDNASSKFTQAKSSYLLSIEKGSKYDELNSQLRGKTSQRADKQEERNNIVIAAEEYSNVISLRAKVQKDIVTGQVGLIKKSQNDLKVLVDSIEKREKAQNKLDLEITKLQEDINSLRKERDRHITIEPNNEFNAWLISLTEKNLAENKLKASSDKVFTSATKYFKLLEKTSPPFVERITISGKNIGAVYEAEWQPVGGKDKPTQQADIDAAKLRDALKILEHDIKKNEEELREANREEDLIKPYKQLSDDIQEQASDYGSAKEWAVLGPMFIEMAGVIVEVALSGGAETARRKAAEIAAEQSFKVVTAEVSKIGADATMRLVVNKVTDALELNPRDAVQIAIADTIETAIAGVGDASYKGFQSRYPLFTEKRLHQILTGEKPLAGKVTLKNYKSSIKKSAGPAAITTILKGLAAEYFTSRANFAEKILFQKMATHTQYQLLLDSTWPLHNKLTTMLSQHKIAAIDVRNRLHKLRQPRELKTSVDNIIPKEDLPTEFSINLQFSVPLTNPPTTHIGNKAVTMTPVTQAPTQNWKGTITFDEKEIPESNNEYIPIKIELNSANKPFANLDSDPASPATMDINTSNWKKLESGPDRNHQVKLVESQPDIYGLWVSEGGSTLEIKKGMFSKHPIESVSGIWKNVSEGGRSVGFKDGDDAFRGDYDGQTIKGEMYLRFQTTKTYDGANECFSEGVWDKFELSLANNDKNILKGWYKDSRLLQYKCAMEDNDRSPVQFTRKEDKK